MNVTTGRGSWAGERVLMLSPTPTHPQDYGNRKRIFQTCSLLQSEGAEITFVHYPAEAEWRRTIPWEAEHAMARAWGRYYTIPPSRQLHMAARGSHHTIDEWWDDSIGTFLSWLFWVQTFDTFIVNYAWLSRAFEFAPPSVMKILDTHDKKSGRRELLEQHGIAPEFFFTTEEQEAIALNRANLVWAIKDEERIHFERIGRSPAVAVPHLDPLNVPPRPQPDPDGYFRVGFLAARNSINHINLREFLRVAEPIFRNAFAPVKIVVAGSICDLFDGNDSPMIERRGRIADVGAFYRSVDCVAVPMTFSTGLKIKTGEAISAGVPVVSTAHAFEGYEAADPLHTLADSESVANALVDLSFAPRARLEELAEASLRSHAATMQTISTGIARTRALVREKQQSVVVAVDSRAFVPGTVFNQVLRSLYEYVRAMTNVVVVVVKGSAAHLAATDSGIGQFGRVLFADDLDDIADHVAFLASKRVDCVNLAEYLADKGVKVLIADALHETFSSDSAARLVLFVRTEMIALSEGRPDFIMPGENARRAFVVAPAFSRHAAAAQALTSGSIILAPCFRGGHEFIRNLRTATETEVVILGAANSRATTLALALAATWNMKPRVLSAFGPGRSGHTGVQDYIQSLIDGRASAPLFALDFSAGAPGLQICRELLERQGVPVIAGQPFGQPSFDPRGQPGRIATESELFEVFRAFAFDPQTAKHHLFQSMRDALESDRGWAYIWGFCKQLFETRDAEFS